MKKGFLAKLLLCLLLVCISAFCFTACGDNSNNANNGNNQNQNQNGDTDNRDSDIVAIYNLYVANAQSNGQTPLTYEEWLLSIKGEKGDKGDKGDQGVQGEKGDKGDQGAQGEKGDPGEDGKDGVDGVDGAPGKDGQDGVGIEDIYVGEDGHLYVKLTGDTEYRDLGKVTGESTQPGESVEYSQGLEYVANSDKTGYAVKSAGLCLDKDIVIPSTYLGKPVTEIKEDAFQYENLITSVKIPNSVTSIGSYAFFDCTSLTRVDYTGTIDQWAQIEFSYYNSNPLDYANNLYIDGELVTEAKLTTATKISAYAFYNCTSLTSVEIPDSVTSIGGNAFENCVSLSNITFNGSIEEWNMIEKDYDWNENVSTEFVNCIDGKVYFNSPFQVTESEFNAALDIDGAPFQAVVTTSYSEIGGEDSSAMAKITYNVGKIKLEQPIQGQEQTMYYEKVDNNYFFYVMQNGSYMKTTAPEEAYNSCLMYTPAGMLAELGYSDFTYNTETKSYVYSEVDASEGASVSMKLYFENKKVVKMEIVMVMGGEGSATIEVTYAYENITVTLPEVGGAGQPDGGDEGEHVCDMQATAWFDAERHYPKTLECECGEKETRTRIQITNADELVMLGEDMNAGYNIGSANIDIANDIDMEDKQWTPIIVNNMMQETKIRGAEDGVTISNLTSDVGFIQEVLTGLTLENITLEGASISNTEGCAGAFIGVINVGSGLATNVTIKKCSVVDSEIIASYTGDDNACFAGAIYGKMADETAIDTLTIDNCSVLNTNVQSNVYAGSIAGAFSPLVSGATANVSLINCVFEDVTVSSLVKNGAGRVVGISGFGSCNMDQETSDCANLTVTATGAGENRNDVYGVTGWNSMTDCGTLVYGAAMQLKYDRAVNSLDD